jgi:hypothetical protein
MSQMLIQQVLEIFWMMMMVVLEMELKKINMQD